MRLIDADALNAVFINVADHLEEQGKTEFASMFRCAVGYVNNAATVAEILQCKDCEYYEKNAFGMKSKDKMFCGKCGGLTRNSGEDFCSYAKKREGAEGKDINVRTKKEADK